MLRFLQIRDYAIVDSLDLDVSTGFTCITGETGAGKSILVGALGLLCGERADSSKQLLLLLQKIGVSAGQTFLQIGTVQI